tara:strand:- start:90642 stop:91391 length:750 start_codon:yes stop_codon:yes gene_type:complete
MAKKVIPVSDLPVFSKNSSFPDNPELFSSGAIILMDKPQDWSSFDLVKFVRNRIPPKKVGHAGTLDPMATGLLILCSGKATKSISQIQSMKKRYVTKIRFGSSTPSFDAATEIDETADWDHIDALMLEEKLKSEFTGIISQVPPIYSAIQIKGERLYKIARRGGSVDIEPRDITIYEIKILDVSMPDVTLEVYCGKGTYIRSLAHDLGISLKSRAHMIELRRSETGGFSVDDSYTPDQFEVEMKTLKDV